MWVNPFLPYWNFLVYVSSSCFSLPIAEFVYKARYQSRNGRGVRYQRPIEIRCIQYIIYIQERASWKKHIAGEFERKIHDYSHSNMEFEHLFKGLRSEVNETKRKVGNLPPTVGLRLGHTKERARWSRGRHAKEDDKHLVPVRSHG